MRDKIQDFLQYQAPLTNEELDGVVEIAEKFALDFSDFVQKTKWDSSGKYLNKTNGELLSIYKEMKGV